MASIIISDVSLNFPIYGAGHQSLRKTFFARTGGLIRRERDIYRRIVVNALTNISFELNHGDRLGLIGHNGAGKSTLLRLLAGVYWPDSGSVRVVGRVSPLFNSAPGLDPEDSGYENIKTCGMFLGMTGSDVARKQAEIAEFSELGEYLDLPVRTYSTGMVTRLCFAIATAIDPDILLLDEGLAAGDAGFAARAETRMQTMISRAAILVLATHSEALIRSICNRALLLQKGRLVAMGPVDEIIEMYHRYITNSAMQIA